MKNLTIEEVINLLVNTNDYSSIRKDISDKYINFIRDVLSDDFERIKEREDRYQEELILKGMYDYYSSCKPEPFNFQKYIKPNNEL